MQIVNFILKPTLETCGNNALKKIEEIKRNLNCILEGGSKLLSFYGKKNKNKTKKL